MLRQEPGGAWGIVSGGVSILWKGQRRLGLAPQDRELFPFKVPKGAPPEEVSEACEKFERYLVEERPDLVARLPEIRGTTLACWCKPGPCHGDVLVRLADESTT